MGRQARRWRRVAGVVAAAVVVLGSGPLVGPAAAATPDAYGFAYLDSPSQMIGLAYVPDLTHQYTTAGGAVSITRTAVGAYTVRLPGIGRQHGIAHVTAVNTSPVWCQLRTYFISGADELVLVSCTQYAVGPVDSRFTVLFSSSSAPPAAGPGAYGTVRSDSAGVVQESYSSTPGPVSVVHGPVGNYTATFSALGAPGTAGDVQVTAVNAGISAHCKVATWSVAPAGVTVQVRCFDASGVVFDTGWTMTYQRERAVAGGVGPPKLFGYLYDIPAAPPGTNYNSTVGPPNTVSSAGTGLRLVTFPRVGMTQNHVQVTAVGFGSQWCGLNTIWATMGMNAVVRDVVCFSGLLMSNQPFLVTYTSRF
jgi:hypothetical protein